MFDAPACETGKETFATKNKAWSVALQYRKRRKDKGHRKHTHPYPYKCSFCGRWHIGTSPRSERR